MEALSLEQFKEIYQNFYCYCISGKQEVRKSILQVESDITQLNDNQLEYIYSVVKYSDGMDDEESRRRFISRVDEADKVISDPVHRWCYYLVLELSYTYIYPDVQKVKQIKQLKEEFKTLSITEEEQNQIASVLSRFDMADYLIKKHNENGKTMKMAYGEIGYGRDFRLKKRNYLMILKGFSSSTPLFYPALEGKFYHSPIKGGGMFLQWNGYGIAIDPGINFIENMHLNGLTMEDINAVVVTHNHIDHNGDLMIIDDLAQQLNRKNIVLYADQDTLKNAGQFKTFRNCNVLNCLSFEEYNLGDMNEITLKYCSTQHIPEEVDESNKPIKYQDNASFAVKFILSETGSETKTVAFTSDTRYFSGLSEFLSDCDYIVANMSETSKMDYSNGQKKEKHLGYQGCLDLIKECCNQKGNDTQKTHFVVSEFWAGKGDVRRELIQKLRTDSICTSVYPGDIGMTFFLDRPTFLCEYCGCETEMDKLHFIREKAEYGKILMVCENCLL